MHLLASAALAAPGRDVERAFEKRSVRMLHRDGRLAARPP